MKTIKEILSYKFLPYLEEHEEPFELDYEIQRPQLTCGLLFIKIGFIK